MYAELAGRLKRIEQALALLRFPLPPQMLTVSDAAKICRVSRGSVRRWIDTGELRACGLQLRRQAIYRIAQADLQAFLDGKLIPCPNCAVSKRPVKLIRIPNCRV